MPGALDGVRILDLSWGIAGPLGTLLLAEHGADVIKVEPPGGDPFRGYDGYRVWTRSRRSVRCDLKSDAGREAFLRLAETADVVVDAFRPGVMDRLGIGDAALRAVNPRVITCSVPGYPEGHRWADRPGYDALVQASSGQQWEQPGWRMGPIFLHMPMPSMGTVYLVPTAILAALHDRERRGVGQAVQTSLLQGVMLYTSQIWQLVEQGGNDFFELMGKSYPPGIHQQMIYECKDREWVHASVLSGLTPIKGQDELLGLEDAPDPFTFMAMPPEEREVINQRRREKFLEHDRDALVAAFRENNHAIEPILSPDEKYAHPQIVANGMTIELEEPGLGTVTQMGIPIHLFGTPGEVKGRSPAVGEHDTEIWGDELGLSPAEVAAVVGSDAPAAAPPVAPVRTVPRARPPRALAPLAAGERRAPQGPLTGLRVIDFGQHLAGPFGPMILGDLGADVIKVEPVFGDAMRLAGQPFFGCQRGKRSIAIDLKSDAGRQLALDLVATADIVHHNMTVGVATRLGIDYEACRAVRPDVIYCNTYAYGLEGPLAHFGGLDPLYQATGGIEFEAGGTQHGNTPLYYRFGMCDASNAMLSVIGVLLALHHRDRTGEGQELWTSLLDGSVLFTSDVILVDGRPIDRPRVDPGLHGLAPHYRLYRCQDDVWLQVAAVTDAERDRLADALEIDRDAGAEAYEAAFASKTSQQWRRRLDDVDVPAEVARDTYAGEAFLTDEDHDALGLVAQYVHPTMGTTRQLGNVIDFAATPGAPQGPPPLMGEHTREILESLGKSAADVDALYAAGTVCDPPPDRPW